jgi:hypothetical protein
MKNGGLALLVASPKHGGPEDADRKDQMPAEVKELARQAYRAMQDDDEAAFAKALWAMCKVASY